MGAIQIIGLIGGGCALFFALAAGILHFKIRQLFSLISEDQYEQVMPIVEKQRRKVYILAGLSTLFTILTIVMAIINNT
jgi:hypothetical protein